MDNIVTVLFEVESEAYQAFSNLRTSPASSTYTVAEAALLKKDGDSISVIESVDSGVRSTDDTITGLLVGSIAGILAGPLGVLFGASYGALVGATVDLIDADEDSSLIEQVAAKLYDGETAIIALVQEDEQSSFDSVFDGLTATIIRRDAASVAEDVERAREAEAARVAREQVRAQRETDVHNKVEGYRAAIEAKFDKIKALHAQNRAELRDNLSEVFGFKSKGTTSAPVGVELADQKMEGVSGGVATVNVDLSIDVINQLNAYITNCKIGNMSLEEAISGLVTLHLSPGQMVLATEYVRSKWVTL